MNSKMKEAESRPSDALEAPLAGKLRRSSRLSRADSPSKSKSTPPQSHRADPPSSAISNQVFLFFWHAFSPVMYTLYKIDIPKRPPPPPAKTSQELKLSPLCPMLTLKTGKYPERMCCVQLGSKLYFFGGEFNSTNPYIDEDVIKELKNVKRDVFPPSVYFLDLANHSDTLSGEDDKLPCCKPMNSGKASPQAFVADGKIYVIGSTIQMNIIDKSKLKDLDLESFAYFEVYDPEVAMWKILPNPPIRDMNIKWVGHAVVEKTALLTAWQRGKKCVYFFDLDKHEWKKYASLPSYPGNFSGRIEYVEDTVYGCYGNTIAAIARLAAAEEKEEEKEEDEIEEEEEEEDEIEQVPSLLEHHGLHLVSEKMGMDAIFNVPPQLQSSSSLLHLGNRYFCYVKTGMPPQMNGFDHAIEDDKRRFISVVIFQALGKTYKGKEHATRLFSAKFLHSAHYVVNNPFPSEGFIEGVFYHPFPSEGFIEDFFSPGLVFAKNLVQQALTVLRLDGIQITSLPAERQLVTLERLSISGNLLTCLPETIGSLRNLCLLDVSYNKLKSLPESIGSCFSLEELQANDNLIKDLPASICNLIHLKLLCLDNNNMKQLLFSSLVTLEWLSISGNLLTCLPETIGSLRNLWLLDVSYNKLKSLPESIGSCFSLEELQANDNLIKDLPASICNLIHLKSLCLDNNNVNQIPLNLLEDCKVLWNISLHGNPISMDQFQQAFPNEVFDLDRSVRSLDLTHNKIVDIPMDISKSINMQHLIFAKNLVRQVPTNLAKLQCLTVMTLDGIQITSLPAERQLVTLERLSISGNLLTCLPETIGSLRNLWLLDVSYNKLKSLPESIGSCFSLEELQANDNLIEDLPASICNLIHLKSLCLDNNNVNQIPLNLPEDCKVLRNISLHGNPISMDQFLQTRGQGLISWGHLNSKGSHKFKNGFHCSLG